MLQRLEARISDAERVLTNARLSSDERGLVVTSGFGSRVTTAESESDLDDWVIVHRVEVVDLE